MIVNLTITCVFLFVNDDLTHFGNDFDIMTVMTITVKLALLIICSPTWGREKLKVRLFHFHFLLHTFLALQFVKERNFTPCGEFWEKVYFYVRKLYCTWGHGGKLRCLKLECALLAKMKQNPTFWFRGLLMLSCGNIEIWLPCQYPINSPWKDTTDLIITITIIIEKIKPPPPPDPHPGLPASRLGRPGGGREQSCLPRWPGFHLC